MTLHATIAEPLTIPSHRLRVAVADDESEMRTFLAKACTHLGHEVVVSASDGLELVNQCLIARPDLVISDVIMPEVNGLDALEQIREKVDTKAIIITAHDWPELRSRAIGMGVKVFLTKPIGINELQPAIDSAMMST